MKKGATWKYPNRLLSVITGGIRNRASPRKQFASERHILSFALLSLIGSQLLFSLTLSLVGQREALSPSISVRLVRIFDA
jgi:hypothetical protein